MFRASEILVSFMASGLGFTVFGAFVVLGHFRVCLIGS